MNTQNRNSADSLNGFVRLKHPTQKLPKIKIPLSVYESAEVFADQESESDTEASRTAAIYDFSYAFLLLDDNSYAAKAAIISRDYLVPIDQVASLAHRSGFGNALMAAKFYQLLHDQGNCPDIEAAFACWYDLKDKLLNEDYDALTREEIGILRDNRHFHELDLPSFAPHLEVMAERASAKEDGTDYHFKLEPSLPRLPGGLTGVPVEIRENIYNYFFGEEDVDRERDRMDPEKRVRYPSRYKIADHYLVEIGADRIDENVENES